MHEVFTYILTGVVLILFLYIFWKVLKKVIVNSVVGLFLLFLFKFAFQLPIPINLATIGVTAVFGLAGVGSLLILSLSGMLTPP